jgi:hypothetical protein
VELLIPLGAAFVAILVGAMNPGRGVRLTGRAAVTWARNFWLMASRPVFLGPLGMKRLSEAK